MAEYLGDWLARRDAPATDLDLVVLLLNSLDLLADPADRLTSLAWFREVLTDVGRGDLARDLCAAGLGPLRDLRESLRAVFAAPAPAQAAALLNRMLLGAGAVPQLVPAGAGLRLEVAPGQRGLAALQARLPAALAEHVAHRGTARKTDEGCRVPAAGGQVPLAGRPRRQVARRHIRAGPALLLPARPDA